MFIAKFIGVFFVEQNYTKETRGSNFAYLKGTCILNLNFSSNFDVFFVVVETGELKSVYLPFLFLVYNSNAH
jgi:hypothetical protein